MSLGISQFIVGGTAVFTLALLALIMANWGQPHMKYLAWMAGLSAINSVGYFLEISAPTLDAAILAYKVQYLSGPFMGIVAAFFSLEYAGYRGLNHILKGALFIVPVFITLLVVGGNPIPSAYVSEFALVPAGKTLLLTFHVGPLYFVNFIYCYALFLFSLLLLVWKFVHTGRSLISNVIFVVVASLPVATKLLSWKGIFPELELFNTAALFLLIVQYWYIMRDQEVEWRSLGWNAIVGKLTDAVIVINEHQIIINTNPIFSVLFSGFDYQERRSTLGDFIRYLKDRSVEILPGTLFDDLNISPGVGKIGDFIQGEFTTNPDRQSFALVRQIIRRGSPASSRVLGQTIVLSNISAYRTMIAQIVELKQKAEEASRSKTEFLATMSHEIRTPLNAIIGYSELLLQRELPHDAHTDLEKIYDSGSILSGIISDILDISKIETGNLELVPVDYGVPGLINDTIRLNLLRIGPKPITFELEIDETLPVKLNGDELRVKQILNNLLSNAIKYTQEGKITLRINWTAEENEQAAIRFTVIDTGQGIKQEDMGKLFSQYRQLNMKANRFIEGTGLGLSITKNLVEMMGGTIAVESEYGKGSAFTALIRQVIVDGSAMGKEMVENLRQFRFVDSRRNRRKSIRIRMPKGRALVVDDVQTNLDVAQRLMQPYGLRVDGVKSGPEAIELIRSGNPPYDMIFMDHMMPGMDGIETTRIIRKLDTEYARDLPIVALTANALAGNRELFFQNGINDFLAKPIDMQRLNAVLERWIPLDKQEKAEDTKVENSNTEKTEGTGEAPAIRIPGIDTVQGMENTGGSLEGYRQILMVFCADAKERVPQIQSSLANGDYPRYTTMAHALKGAARTIGAMEFGNFAFRLEQAGKAHDQALMDAETDRLLEELRVLMDNISAALEEDSDTYDDA
ncbi:hypothetical protein AGMMS49546_31680 [Spirochaetia bacterium]|nr:hypothetical protein AGMMS49546_31680 [Spirochaetia bacterium]